MIKTIVVDDEPHAREDLTSRIRQDSEFNVIGECANAFEAIRDINCKEPDVVFLDINMPKITGIEMLSMLDKDTLPRIVFVTAHGEYAIEAFEKNAIDFLLKPVSDQRLNITMQRLKENHQPQAMVSEAFSANLKFVPCYRGSQYYLINVKEIVHAYSSPTTGVHLLTKESTQAYHTNISLKVFEDNSDLIRCHRQHLVNPEAIKFIEKLDNGLGRIFLHEDYTIPVSRNYMDSFPAIS